MKLSERIRKLDNPYMGGLAIEAAQLEAENASLTEKVERLREAGRNYMRADAVYHFASFKRHWFVVSEASYKRAQAQYYKWKAYAGVLFGIGPSHRR